MDVRPSTPHSARRRNTGRWVAATLALVVFQLVSVMLFER